MVSKFLSQCCDVHPADKVYLVVLDSITAYRILLRMLNSVHLNAHVAVFPEVSESLMLGFVSILLLYPNL